MPQRNYGPATAIGQIRDRVWRITLEHQNPSSGFGILPRMDIHEEQAVRVRLEEPTALDPRPAEVSIGSTRTFTLVFTPGAEYPIRNPATDVLTGDTSTDDLLYTLLYSKVRKAQEDLDAAESQQVPE